MSKEVRIQSNSGLNINGFKVHDLSLTSDSDKQDLRINNGIYDFDELLYERSFFLVQFLKLYKEKFPTRLHIWKSMQDYKGFSLTRNYRFIIGIVFYDKNLDKLDNTISFELPLYKEHRNQINFWDFCDFAERKEKAELVAVEAENLLYGDQLLNFSKFQEILKTFFI